MNSLLLSLTMTATASFPAPISQPSPAQLNVMRQEMIRALNSARAQKHTCGNQEMPAAPPLHYDAALNKSAQEYALRLASLGKVQHIDPELGDQAQRNEAAGFRGINNENLAYGYHTVKDTVQGWLNSPPHCVNVMSNVPSALGIGLAYRSVPPATTMWVMEVGKPATP